ncbi:glutathione S-transferase family protein [soil metagenome]
MKLYYSTTSPYVRKVIVCAIELGLDGEIERVPTKVSPVERTSPVIADNPIGKVPTLIGREGAPLYDSRVICEYLDHTAGGGRLFPSGRGRWRALTDQALADGILDAGLLARYETNTRPKDLHWPAWHAGQMDKVTKGLDRLEQQAADLGDRLDIGTIAIGAALGYLDFRYPDLGWRKGRGRLADWQAAFDARPSMATTRPRE